MNKLFATLKAKWLAAWQHRTKYLGGIFVAAGYVQNNYAQSGIHLPAKYEGSFLGLAGIITFALGLYNVWSRANPGATGSDPPST